MKKTAAFVVLALVSFPCTKTVAESDKATSRGAPMLERSLTDENPKSAEEQKKDAFIQELRGKASAEAKKEIGKSTRNFWNKL